MCRRRADGLLRRPRRSRIDIVRPSRPAPRARSKTHSQRIPLIAIPLLLAADSLGAAQQCQGSISLYCTVFGYSDCSTSSDLPQDMCEAWQLLWDQTNGTGWTHCHEPKYRDDPCACSYVDDTFRTRTGVMCRNKAITRVSFDHNNLNGTLPRELEHLTQMQELTLSNNAIRGPLPQLPPSITT